MKTCVDIAVVGGGAAGIAAAVSAARGGCATLLLDRSHGVGGTGGWSGLTTLCGLYDDRGNFLNDGFPREFAAAVSENAPLRMGRVWALPYQPKNFRAAAKEFLSATPNLETCWNTPLADVRVQGSRICHLNGLSVGAVVDCSGTAEAARSIGAKCLATDETTQAPAIIFPLHGVTRRFHTPADAAQALLPLARAGLPPMSFQPGFEPGTVSVKFTGRADQVGHVIECLRQSVTGFEKCETPLKDFLPAQRAGRMVIGRYLLTGDDVLSGRRFSDAVARCAWPIEQWGKDGVARFRYLSDGAHYEIPARSLRAANVENLFMAGKTISADVDAIASARVMGCCLATGEAAGNLAVRYLESTAKA